MLSVQQVLQELPELSEQQVQQELLVQQVQPEPQDQQVLQELLDQLVLQDLQGLEWDQQVQPAQQVLLELPDR